MKYFAQVPALLAGLLLAGCVSDLYLGGEQSDPGDAGTSDGDTTDAGDTSTDADPVTDAACCDAEDLAACQANDSECECECDEVDGTCVGATCEETDDS